MPEKDQSRLETLLRPLRRQEQEARQDFLRAARTVRDLEADVRRCRAALASQDAWARETLRDGRTEDLALYRQRVAELGRELASRHSGLSDQARQLQAMRRELVRRMRQRKAIEELLRRREAEAASRALRKETAAQDHLHAAQAAWRLETQAETQP